MQQTDNSFQNGGEASRFRRACDGIRTLRDSCKFVKVSDLPLSLSSPSSSSPGATVEDSGITLFDLIRSSVLDFLTADTVNNPLQINDDGDAAKSSAGSSAVLGFFAQWCLVEGTSDVVAVIDGARSYGVAAPYLRRLYRHLIIVLGAKLNPPKPQSTPLHAAVLAGNEAVYRFLAGGTDSWIALTDSEEGEGEGVKDAVAEGGHAANAPAPTSNTSNDALTTGVTALPSVIKTMCEVLCADVFIAAARNGHPDPFAALIRAGADPTAETGGGRSKMTAIEVALACDSTGLMAEGLLRAFDEEYGLARGVVTSATSMELVTRRLKPTKASPLCLLERRGDATGRTLLQIAVMKGDVALATLLLRLGAVVNTLDWHSNTTLHIAIYSGGGGLPMLRLLLDAGASISTMQGWGGTAMHAIMAYGLGRQAMEWTDNSYGSATAPPSFKKVAIPGATCLIGHALESSYTRCGFSCDTCQLMTSSRIALRCVGGCLHDTCLACIQQFLGLKCPHWEEAAEGKGEGGDDSHNLVVVTREGGEEEDDFEDGEDGEDDDDGDEDGDDDDDGGDDENNENNARSDMYTCGRCESTFRSAEGFACRSCPHPPLYVCLECACAQHATRVAAGKLPEKKGPIPLREIEDENEHDAEEDPFYFRRPYKPLDSLVKDFIDNVADAPYERFWNVLAMFDLFVSNGGDINAKDQMGVTPLHRLIMWMPGAAFSPVVWASGCADKALVARSDPRELLVSRMLTDGQGYHEYKNGNEGDEDDDDDDSDYDDDDDDDGDDNTDDSDDDALLAASGGDEDADHSDSAVGRQCPLAPAVGEAKRYATLKAFFNSKDAVRELRYLSESIDDMMDDGEGRDGAQVLSKLLRLMKTGDIDKLWPFPEEAKRVGTLRDWTMAFILIFAFVVRYADKIDFSATDIRGETVLHYAARHASPTAMAVLLFIMKRAEEEISQNAPESDDSNTSNNDSPLASLGNSIPAGKINPSVAALSLNARDSLGRTPLHCIDPSVSLCSHQLALLLLSNGADIDATDARGNTPLMMAVRYRSTISDDDLMDTHSDVLVSRHGLNDTALFRAHDALKASQWADFGNYQVMCYASFLLEQGASPTAVNNEGRSVAECCNTVVCEDLILWEGGGKAGHH